jgi:hypothetical protein
MMYEIDKAAKEAKRPLFWSGIDGMIPGLATELADPSHWNAKDATGDYLIPDGSLIFVDEAWKWFGHLHNATGQKTPPYVLELAEHGHRGLDFVFTTQGPGQLYPFLRTLIADHTHVVRAMGMQAANLYTWSELNEDVKSRSMRDLALKQLWAYPKDLFDRYKSASVHTVKRKIPMKVLLLPAFVIAAAASAWFAFQMLKPDAPGQKADIEGPSADLSAPAPADPEKPREPLTAQQWLERFQPRFSEMPASAPAWDEREVVSEPRVFCAISGPGETATGYASESRCTCLTEQGTRHAMPRASCVALVNAGGTYDPFKAPEKERGGEQRVQGRSPAAMTAPAVAPVSAGAAGAGLQPPDYGAMRGVATP